MKKRKIAVRIACFICIVGLLLVFLNEFLCLPGERDSMHIFGFYLEPENSLDTVLVGSSEFYTCFSPPLSYKECGFTSYQIAYGGAPAIVYPSMIREVYSRQNPKLLVIEINGFLYSDEQMVKEGPIRKWIDNMPMSANKVQTINECVPEDQRADYYIKLRKYHSNWQHFPSCFGLMCDKLGMMSDGVSLTKSLSTKTAISHFDGKKLTNDKNLCLADAGKKALDDVISTCKSLGAQNVLFIRSPHRATIKSEFTDYIRSTVEKSGYDFENFNNSFDEIGIDINHDFYNSSHMNAFGTEAFTRFFAKHINDRYSLKSDKPDDIVAQWDKCADYTEKAFDFLKKKTEQNTGEVYSDTTDFSLDESLIVPKEPGTPDKKPWFRKNEEQ